jgi:hypothetical protein
LHQNTLFVSRRAEAQILQLSKETQVDKKVETQLRHQVKVVHHATSTWVGWPASSDSGKSAELEAEKVASGKPQ